MNVQQARRLLREARIAFERGDYATATRRAYEVLGLFPAGPAMPTVRTAASSPIAASPPAAADRNRASVRLAAAIQTVERARARGLNVQVAKAALKQARKALRAGDYLGTVEYAGQAEQLCWSTGRARS